MPKPLIYLAFANHKDAYLQNLDRERKEIKEKLSNAIDEGTILLEHESATNLDDIFDVFDRYRGQVKIFHFGGHADMESLMLDGQTAQGKALAELLAEENRLGGIELVFLNGCATLGHVEKILDAGVTAVIATSVKINDGLATEFSIQFYQSFAAGAGIDEAYKRAAAKIKATQDNSLSRFQEFGNVRLIGPIRNRNERGESFPWALYTEASRQAQLTWSLNTVSQSNLDSFKQELIDLVNQSQFNDVFTKIEKSNYTYDKFLFNRLRQQFQYGANFDSVNQLKVFIGAIREGN